MSSRTSDLYHERMSLCCEADRVRHDRVKRSTLWTQRVGAWFWDVRVMHWKGGMIFWHWSDTVIADRCIPR